MFVTILSIAFSAQSYATAEHMYSCAVVHSACGMVCYGSVYQSSLLAMDR